MQSVRMGLGYRLWEFGLMPLVLQHIDNFFGELPGTMVSQLSALAVAHLSYTHRIKTG